MAAKNDKLSAGNRKKNTTVKAKKGEKQKGGNVSLRNCIIIRQQVGLQGLPH